MCDAKKKEKNKKKKGCSPAGYGFDLYFYPKKNL